MIQKIVTLQNLGRFLNPTFGKDNWNGVLEQTNVFYAQNGSGKTTLSLLFRSLKGNDDLISKKKTFSSKEQPNILLIDDQRKEIKFNKGKWNKHFSNIEIYDSFYIDDNVYIITIGDGLEKPNFFELILGEESVGIRKEIDNLIDQRQKLRKKRGNLRYQKRNTENEDEKAKIAEKISENLIIVEGIAKQIEDLEKKLIDTSSAIRDKFLEKINSYLRMFNHNLKINKLSQKKYRVIYSLQVSGHEIRTTEKSNYSLRYSLSEGDKNALALSFFLARLDLIEGLKDYTLIIDDPITSFDYSRKNTTLNNLISLGRKVKCFILLTHDLGFAGEFSRRINYQCKNLKIVFNGTTSLIKEHDIERETLTGIFKDITVLHEFLKTGADTDLQRRDTVRCIRPVIEGIFRIKYFGQIEKTEWLGDIIGKIRDCENGSPFYRLKDQLGELIEINDYCKEYHHSNPYYLEVPLNEEELRNYILRSIQLIQKI